MRNYLLFLLALFYVSVLSAQTVNIYIDDRVGGYPDLATVQTNYQNAGFGTVNITSGLIDGTVTTANYDVLIINEYYNYSSGVSNFVPNFLTGVQRSIAETFADNGGHIIWIAESWVSSPAGGPIAQSTGMITTVNNLYGTSITYGPYFSNGGMGSPSMPRIHPSNGPGALSPSSTILASGSYATLLNVIPESAVYTSDFFDNTTFFDACTHTTIALFPPLPTPGNGSIIVSTEVAIPFKGTNPNPWGGPLIYNTQLDAGIATLHFNLITGLSMIPINSWLTIPGNSNAGCPPIALPVELVSFEVELSSNRDAQLTWRTASEKNTSHFEVERSLDLTNWTFTGKVQAAGNSQQLLHYTLRDRNIPSGINYYRLKLIDIDGQHTYSNVKSVDVSSEDITIHLNPSTEILTIAGLDKTSNVQLYAMNGKTLNYTSESTEDVVTISTHFLSPGVYFVVANSASNVRSLRFIVHR